jgi:hypothetical protein
MKKIIIGLTLLCSLSAFAKTSECSFEAGRVTNAVTLNVSYGDKPYIGEEDSGMRCETIDFTSELAQQVLEAKVSTVESFYGEEAAAQARVVYSKQLEAAAGGKMVDCKDSPMSRVGIIVNGENSFIVMNGGNAYFEMTEGSCK